MLQTRYLPLGVAMIVIGCARPGPLRELVPVSGLVTYAMEPLSTGTIVFQPPAGPPAFARLRDDGTFALDAVVGTNQVIIESRAEAEPSEDARPTRGASLIPEKYSQPGNGLTVEIEAGAPQYFEFDLQD